MGKLIGAIVATIICGLIGLIPEIAMYFIYQAIEPVETWEKILTFGVFWIGGAGLCVIFGFLGLALWTAIMKEIL